MIFDSIFEYSVFDVVIINDGNIFFLFFVNRYAISTLDRKRYDHFNNQ